MNLNRGDYIFHDLRVGGNSQYRKRVVSKTESFGADLLLTRVYAP
jgi:hypothetical protein